MSRGSQTLTEQSYRRIRNRILAGQYPSGTALREEALSRDLATSRTPVRAALKRLESEGLLEQVEGRVLRVPRMTMEDMDETFVARRLVEGKIAELAADRATAEEFRRLRQYIDDEQEAARTGETGFVLNMDRLFHGTLAKVAGNPLLGEFQGRISTKVTLFLVLSGTLEEAMISRALDEHQQLLAALEARAPSSARQVMVRHLDNVLVRLREAVSGA
ncbi:MAG: GntR family transcriptional regulator [Synergistales bacterium]|nr:GntR family transcriptional regulator [Synergistales bacterium]